LSGILAEERHRSGPKPVVRCLRGQDRAADARSEIGERDTQDLGVDRFLRFEVDVKQGRSEHSPGRAILDINLRGRKTFPVLAGRRVPFVFATRSPTPYRLATRTCAASKTTPPRVICSALEAVIAAHSKD
jgi:hypothetical protein